MYRHFFTFISANYTHCLKLEKQGKLPNIEIYMVT